ncbi:MAG: lysophospholipid acyltransferase family protein [bacterium]
MKTKEPFNFWASLARSRAFWFCYDLFFRVLFRLKVKGSEKCPRNGPVVFVGNHGSNYDLFFCLALVGRYKKKYKRPIVPVVWDGVLAMPVIGPFLKALSAVPVNDDSIVERMTTMRLMLDHLKEGRSLLMSCEGVRLDELGKFQLGAALVAVKARAPLVPVSLRGVQPLFKGLKFPNRFYGNVTFEFHEPIDPRVFSDQSSLEEAKKITNLLRERIALSIDYQDAFMSAKKSL